MGLMGYSIAPMDGGVDRKIIDKWDHLGFFGWGKTLENHLISIWYVEIFDA